MSRESKPSTKSTRADAAPARAGSESLLVDARHIRNVVLVGPSGSGKTSLVEGLLLTAGAITRAGRVEDGSTVSDHDESERRLGRSVSLSVASLTWRGVRVNLIDTPGYADFIGELRAGLRAADAALFVVSAVDGVDAATALLWQECAVLGMPRAVVVTRVDSPRADFDEMVAISQRVLGDGILPLYLPLRDESGVPAGLLDLLGNRVIDHSSGERTEREPDPEHLQLSMNARKDLIEGIITESEDESLMDRFLDGEDVDEETLVSDLESAVARGSFHPALFTALSPAGLGLIEILELMTRGFPSPVEHPLPPVTTLAGDPVAPLDCDPDGPLLAEVIKTTSDPYVGRISLVRVFSGTLSPDATVHVSGHAVREREHDIDERVGAVSSPLGKTLRPLPAGVAGDVVSVAKLAHAETGDTLSSPQQPLLMDRWLLPDPLLPMAIVAHSTADEDRLGQALARIVAEDPTLRIDHSPETGQIVLWCLGESHADVVLERLRVRHGVEVDITPVRIGHRETFAAPASGHGRLVKQSGGHGQFAVVDIEVEPLALGGGFEFVDKVVGGAVPRQYIPSVEKGVRAQLALGLLAGYPVVDVRVTLVDGKAHSVDSSDMAFQHAGQLALKDAAAKGAVSLLEPVDDVVITVADEYVGAVMGDLSGRRGRVAGSEPDGAGRTMIRAEVPQSELTRYAIDLRSLSHGTGSLSRSLHGYEPMPPTVAARVLEPTA